MDIVPVPSLRSPNEDTHLHLKVYRKWTQRRSYGHSDFCCILLNKQGEAIQANMDIRQQPYFDDILKLHSAYEIFNFICEEANMSQQTLENDKSLRFGRITTFDPIPSDDFPEHYFNFLSYNQLESRIPRVSGDTRAQNPLLTDYISCIRFVDDIIKKGDANTIQSIRRKINVENLSGNTLDITLWGTIATNFDKDAWERMEKPVILAISSCNVSRFIDIQLTSSQATHCYLNPNIPEVHESLPRYRAKYQQQPPLIVTRFRHAQNSSNRPQNRQSLQTLLLYNPESYKSVRFTSEITIRFVHTSKIWYYISCTECTNKPYKRGDIYRCIDHGNMQQPSYRFCLKVKADDNTAIADFTFFTPAADKLLNIEYPQETPPQITAMIGQTRTIQFRYNPNTTQTEFIVDDILPTATAPTTASGIPQQLTLEPSHPGDSSGIDTIVTRQSSIPATPTPLQTRQTPITETTPETPSSSQQQHETTTEQTRSRSKRSLFQDTIAPLKKPTP